MLKQIIKYLKLIGFLLLCCIVFPVIFVLSLIIHAPREFCGALKETLNVVWKDEMWLIWEGANYTLKRIWKE